MSKGLHTNLTDTSAAGHLSVPLAMAQGQGLSPFAKLRADMVRVQAAVLAQALAQDFDREAWQQQVEAAEEVVQLRQALALLEGALSEEWLSPLFQRTPRHHRGPRNARCPLHAQLPAGGLGDRPAVLCRAAPGAGTFQWHVHLLVVWTTLDSCF